MFEEVKVNTDRNISIHPGVIGGMRVHPLVNTCKPNKRTGRVFRKVTDRFDERIHDHEATLKSLPSSVNPLSYRKPGSRNPAKLRNR